MRPFAHRCAVAADRVIKGIDDYFKVPKGHVDEGVWFGQIDGNGKAVNPSFHDWLNYAPQMLDLPVKGVGSTEVGHWIHRVLQKSDGACVWNDGNEKNRKSPGFSFQACLVWLDLGQTRYVEDAKKWVLSSGLWQRVPDLNGVEGGWIDWVDDSSILPFSRSIAPFWQRFIDTSFYAIAVFNGGYNFYTSRQQPLMQAS